MSDHASAPDGLFSDIFTGEDRRMLAELGFYAVGGGLPGLAERIFAGLELLCPPGSEGGEAVRIGLALAAMGRDEPETAVEILRRAQPTDAVTVYLGVALAKAGEQAEAREVLEDLLATGPDPNHAGLAQATLDAMAEG